MPPLVSVIVPVYRDWERLTLCLEALGRQTLPAAKTEIILVNNEAEPSSEPAYLPPTARIIHEPRPGSYAARNSGLKVARGEFVAFTDSDCVPSRQWLERGLAILAHHPEARVTGPIPIFRVLGASRLAFVYEYHTAFKQRQAVGLGRCATANLIVARRILDAVGPFNEALVSGGDSEWGDRAYRAGVPIIYDEQVEVRHPARTTVAEIVRKRRRLAGSIAQRKRYPTYRYFLYRLLPPLRHFWRSVIGFKRGPLRPVDWLLLFFVHWRGQFAEGLEFLMVRKGWKPPNRS